MKKYTIIPYKVYPFDVLVSFQSYEELRKLLIKILPEDVHKDINIFEDEYAARTVMFASGQTCIHFNEVTHGRIAHEAFHAISFLMSRIECPLNRDTDEPYAYLLAYLVNEIYQCLPKTLTL